MLITLHVTCDLNTGWSKQRAGLEQPAAAGVQETARNLIDDNHNLESALRFFSSVSGIFGNQQNQHLQLIKQMLVKYLDPSSVPKVLFQVACTVGAFILLHDKDEG
ncbi:importin beta-3 [Culex quinquefasciatus]|uniref:Importin beta-3 n=1 Tax=Culex quinquefasciatus TaxID=7176 RepID=B0WPP4_CULQU|nr:importin beta-3 [Culex quinquefasciatus]|eukprot:XP_001850678.1 importin beta-3 [Culex quinquefasciatus]